MPAAPRTDANNAINDVLSPVAILPASLPVASLLFDVVTFATELLLLETV